MTREVSSDTQEIFGEMQEDLARQKASLRRNRNPQDSNPPGRPMLLWGLIGIILILLLVLLFRGGDKAVTEELNALKTRVEQTEKRAAASETAAKKVDAVDGQIKALQQSIAKVEGNQRSLADRIDKLAQHAEKPAAAQPAPQKKPGAQAKVHEVKPGETLFSIAKKYNIPADQLLKLNNMTKKDTIQAGQKLVVAP
ncbi:MAG: LysM peptidoglycan-binding domain-containing protein [Desulfobacterota bacterium]|jgi:LysM repeat protein|nr:LysM peptidoglycan-binding domain-containing protein [Thermodesulfobacteriota bacterium]